MAALQNALNQAHGLKVKNNPVIKNAMNQINNQKQIIVKNMNKTIRTLNKTGLKQKNMVQSLNLTTKNIAPLTRQADGIKISILKSLQLKQSPVVISQIIKDQKSIIGTKPTVDPSGFVAPKITFIPVPLEKPLAALHQAAGSINNASITKPETPKEEGINAAKTEMDLEPRITQKPKHIEPPKKPGTIDITPTQVSDEGVILFFCS